MIHLVTSRPDCYDSKQLLTADITINNDVKSFIKWAKAQIGKSIQFDTETNVVPFDRNPNQHFDRKLLVMQFGDRTKENQWVIDFTGLSQEWIDAIKSVFELDVFFIIHNAKFDFIVTYMNLGVEIMQIHDTMLMSKVLNGGLDLPGGYHGLAACMRRIFNIDVDKQEQTTFTEAPMSLEQILYAADDVVYLNDLALSLRNALVEENLWYIYDLLEKEIVRIYSKMETVPWGFDEEFWDKLSDKLSEEREEARGAMNKQLLSDPELCTYLADAKEILGEHMIWPYDEYLVNWRSTTHTKKIIQKFVPSLPEKITKKPDRVKWFKANGDKMPEIEKRFLNRLLKREYAVIDKWLQDTHKDWLIENGMYVEEGTLKVNWNSDLQKLFIFQFYYPKLTGVNKDTIGKITNNPLISTYKKYVKVNKAYTTYGPNFKVNNVARDGYFYPIGMDQIKNTGRIS